MSNSRVELIEFDSVMGMVVDSGIGSRNGRSVVISIMRFEC